MALFTERQPFYVIILRSRWDRFTLCAQTNCAGESIWWNIFTACAVYCSIYAARIELYSACAVYCSICAARIELYSAYAVYCSMYAARIELYSAYAVYCSIYAARIELYSACARQQICSLQSSVCRSHFALSKT